jgi:hypothetical protein
MGSTRIACRVGALPATREARSVMRYGRGLYYILLCCGIHLKVASGATPDA